jgi:hypothetical protein
MITAILITCGVLGVVGGLAILRTAYDHWRVARRARHEQRTRSIRQALVMCVLLGNE